MLLVPDEMSTFNIGLQNFLSIRQQDMPRRATYRSPGITWTVLNNIIQLNHHHHHHRLQQNHTSSYSKSSRSSIPCTYYAVHRIESNPVVVIPVLLLKTLSMMTSMCLTHTPSPSLSATNNSRFCWRRCPKICVSFLDWTCPPTWYHGWYGTKRCLCR
jgi:hypothetical protein